MAHNKRQLAGLPRQIGHLHTCAQVRTKDRSDQQSYWAIVIHGVLLTLSVSRTIFFILVQWCIKTGKGQERPTIFRCNSGTQVCLFSPVRQTKVRNSMMCGSFRVFSCTAILNPDNGGLVEIKYYGANG